MIALDGRLATSFTAGLLAAINPCGFVLLPTYLVYFLGMENLRPGAERASVLRALKVSLAVSAGFMSIFVVIGAITKLSTNWLVEKAQWVALVIGLAPARARDRHAVRLPTSVHHPATRRRRNAIAACSRCTCSASPTRSRRSVARSARSRPSCSAASAPTGCSTGITAIALYGVGMALVVTGLTVTLALANTAFLRILRRGMAWFEQLAGVLLILTGMYLCWYWYSSITDGTGGRVVAKATGWNDKLANFVQDHQTAVVWGGVIVIVAAVVTALTRATQRAGVVTDPFAELLATPGVQEVCVLRSSRIGFMAYHGGSLEEQTDVIASLAARAQRRQLLRRAATRGRASAHPVAHRSVASPSPQLEGVHRSRRHRDHDPRLRSPRPLHLAAARRAATASLPSTSPAHLRPRLPEYEIVTDLDRIPQGPPRPASRQPGEPAGAAGRADRAASAHPRLQPDLGRLGSQP